MKITLLPYDQLKLSKEDLIQKIPQSEFDIKSFLQGKNISFFQNAKSSIHYIIQKLKLKRDDEVYISTTSDSNFVSTCVSATIFNYCKISRVLTENTKLIFIIHEFGFYNKETRKLAEIAHEIGIPIVEDSAHSFNSSFNGDQVGKYSDYTIFSLPKSIPVLNGGLLLSIEKNNTKENQTHIKKAFENYTPYINYFNFRRRELYNAFYNELNYQSLFGPVDDNIPFSFIFLSKNSQVINETLENNGIQILRTYNKDWVGLPLNSFINLDKYQSQMNQLFK